MSTPRPSDDDAALEVEFLDYLSTLENDEEDWTWFSEAHAPARERAESEEQTP
jgi:hypothetical protein